MKLFEIDNHKKIQELQRFVVWACNKLEIKNTPKISYSDNLEQVESNRTFGSTAPSGNIWTYVGDRTPADVMRTLCHELVHYKQFELGLASELMNSEQKQRIEDVANAMAGRLLREYGKKHVEIYS